MLGLQAWPPLFLKRCFHNYKLFKHSKKFSRDRLNLKHGEMGLNAESPPPHVFMSLNPWSSISSTAQEGGGRFRLAGENGSLGHTLKWVFQTPLPVCFLLWIQWDQLIGISATMPCPLQYCNIPYHTLARAQLSRVRGHLACHPHASGEYRVSLGSRIRSLALSSRSSCPPPAPPS
jgi:hypothetical protein